MTLTSLVHIPLRDLSSVCGPTSSALSTVSYDEDGMNKVTTHDGDLLHVSYYTLVCQIIPSSLLVPISERGRV